jgi:hypothetical protein
MDLQIFHFCCILGKIKAMLPYTISGKTDIKLPLENAGINEENNCKPHHNHSELLCHWLVEVKQSKSFSIFKINEIKAAPFEPPYLQI